MTELHATNTEGGALEHLIARSKQIQAEHRAIAKRIEQGSETAEDKRNLRMTLRAFVMQSEGKDRGAW